MSASTNDSLLASVGHAVQAAWPYVQQFGSWVLTDVLHLTAQSALLVVFAIIALRVILAKVRAMACARPGGGLDPERLFTSAQKRRGHARAGRRCEMEVIPFIRCRRVSEHGDHWWPHARGGATSMDNFVAACAKHNLAKSAKVPTAWQTRRLEMRRRAYFPNGETYTAGAKYRGR